MADFDPFTQSEEKKEADPVADFLSREEKQFAELDGFGVSTTDFAAKDADLSAEIQRMNEQAEVDRDLHGMDDDDSRFDRYDALKADGPVQVVSEKIRQWQEEQKERLAVKDVESEKRQKEWIQLAKVELEEFYKHREDLLVKTKSGNKEAEGVFVRERDEKKPGGEWERVCRSCDFNPKSATRTTKDVSRLRSLLLQLKQTPNASFIAVK